MPPPFWRAHVQVQGGMKCEEKLTEYVEGLKNLMSKVFVHFRSGPPADWQHRRGSDVEIDVW